MDNLFSSDFWFNLRPGRLIPAFQNLLIGFIIIMVALAIIAFILKKNKKNLYFRFWERILTFTCTNTLIGLVLWFFNHEMITLLSARFWYPLWLVGMIVWLVFIVKFAITIPEKKKKIAEERAYEKYIP